MRLKANWVSHLHTFRKRELQIIFGQCPEGIFDSALELGAGDGFQSTILAKYTRHLTSTDFQSQILLRQSTDSITYAVCDVEEVENSFAGHRFDLVFSSSLLEHVPRPNKALRGIRSVLSDSGITVHVMPSSLWVVCHVGLHIPNFTVSVLQRMLNYFDAGASRRSKLSKGETGMQPLTNNPKTLRRKRTRLARWLVPEPHGVSSSNYQEFFAFSRRRWNREFERAGFRIVAVLTGPFSSGYGFGLDRLRSFFERWGITTEFAYVVTKRDFGSPFERFFVRSGMKSHVEGDTPLV